MKLSPNIHFVVATLTAITYTAAFAVDLEPGHETRDHAGHDHAAQNEDAGHDDQAEHADHADHADHAEHAEHADHAEHDDHDDRDDHADDEDHEDHDDHGKVRLAPEAIKEFGVIVDVAGPGTLHLKTTLPGEVQVNQDHLAHIMPRYPGLVIEVRKSVGDHVVKGDVLAVLEGNESLAMYELKSLMDGTIIERHITIGESLQNDDLVFTVADLRSVWIDLTVYHKDIATVRPGQEVLVRGGKHLPSAWGRISYVSPTVDAHTRTGHARVVLSNDDGAWKPGLFVSGRISLDQPQADVVVPKTALQTLDGEQVVFVQTADGFEPRPVEVGRRGGDDVEIRNGLRSGERYVSRGGFTIKAEMARGDLEHAGHAH